MILIKNFILDSVIHSIILTVLFSFIFSYKVTLWYLIAVIFFSILVSYINHRYFPRFSITELMKTSFSLFYFGGYFEELMGLGQRIFGLGFRASFTYNK
jgi:hypothetical protein